ncbi:MAG: anaerobic ribonucleoside-triphosphate reductase activating protein [Bacteroidales bacterium]|nr:anaerobic ribonucleoside-triphosphate reductase activating protein [Bacteroidales bacterium]
MQIGGFVKQSLIDYPGLVAAVVFTKGCNFRCGYCHNPGLVLPRLFEKKSTYPVKTILDYLKDRAGWLDGVVVTGGEPTIHNDLPEFLKTLKDIGYRVKLDTNGSHPSMLKHILKEKLADYIAMDIKTLLKKEPYGEITGLSEMDHIMKDIYTSFEILKNAEIEVEFRTTVIPGVHNDKILASIKSEVGEEYRYIMNEFREGKTISSF